MTRPILFRSLRSSHDRSGSSLISIQQRGSDWSHLRPYSDTDDIRDIVWNRVKPEGLSTRVRENSGDYRIISYWGNSPYDEFWITHPDESRYHATNRARESIESSAKFGQYSYQEYTGESGLKHLIKMQPRNALIFISNTELTDDIRILAYHNDLIYLDIVHNFEIDPNQNILFSGQILNIKSYRQEYKKIQDAKKKYIKSIKGSYVLLPTTADISEILNIFFKKRYTHE